MYVYSLEINTNMMVTLLAQTMQGPKKTSHCVEL